jgi:hypothetical protein
VPKKAFAAFKIDFSLLHRPFDDMVVKKRPFFTTMKQMDLHQLH